MKNLVALIALPIFCGSMCIVPTSRADSPSENEVIVADSDSASDDTTVRGETSSDGGDAANVENPGVTSGDAKVEVRIDPEGYADIMRANALVERIILLDDSGCQQGNGQIGQVRVCGSSATLSLIGRPALTCPDASSGVFGPCQKS